MTPTPNSSAAAALPWRPGAVRLLLGILIYGLIVVAAGVAQLAAATGTEVVAAHRDIHFAAIGMPVPGTPERLIVGAERAD